MVFMWNCLISSNSNEATWDTVLESGRPGWDDYSGFVREAVLFYLLHKHRLNTHNTQMNSHTHTLKHKKLSSLDMLPCGGVCLTTYVCVCVCLSLCIPM